MHPGAKEVTPSEHVLVIIAFCSAMLRTSMGDLIQAPACLVNLSFPLQYMFSLKQAQLR